MTPRTKRIVELSVQSANEMGTGYVGTEHLLLGILREGQNVALTALANLKITPQILVEKLNEALGGAQDGVSGEPGTAANGGADSKDALSPVWPRPDSRCQGGQAGPGYRPLQGDSACHPDFVPPHQEQPGADW